MDLDSDDLPLSWGETAKEPLVRAGAPKAPCAATPFRWSQKPKISRSGRPVLLGTVMTPRGLRTTRRLLRKYFADLNDTTAATSAPTPPAPALPSHAEAERQLDALGVR